MRYTAVFFVVMLLMGLGCTQEVTTPSTYGVGENFTGAGTAYGNRFGVAVPTYVDVQDAVEEEVTESDTTEKDESGTDLVQDIPADAGCTGSEAYCNCIDNWNDDEFCSCEEENPAETDFSCECLLRVCVDEPDPDFVYTFGMVCPVNFPDECDGF